MKPGKTESLEFSFNGNMEVIAILLDAETHEQLDSTPVIKSKVRDLDGLM